MKYKYLFMSLIIAATTLFPTQRILASGSLNAVGFKECKFKHREPGWKHARLLSWYIVGIKEECPETPIAKHFIVTKTVSRNGDRITWNGVTRENEHCTIHGFINIVRDRDMY